LNSSPLSIQWLGRIDYATALDRQNTLRATCYDGSAPETLLLLEHEGIYTIGRTRDRSSLRDLEHLPHPVVETNRGGQATWHGPGQLVAYPILNIGKRGRDLHRYVRFLEKIIILTCEGLGVAAESRDGLTGVWVHEKKLASIGVGLRQWISMHGLALNVTTASLEPFRHITPCGLSDVQMTCLETEASHPMSVEETGRHLADIFLRELPKLGTRH
jgi:lipoyl(octanoyl) transferase